MNLARTYHRSSSYRSGRPRWAGRMVSRKPLPDLTRPRMVGRVAEHRVVMGSRPRAVVECREVQIAELEVDLGIGRCLLEHLFEELRRLLGSADLAKGG